MESTDHDTCAAIFAMVEDWVDRHLSADDLARVERHLLVCAVCASEFRVEERMLRDLRAKVQRIQAPADLQARVWKRLVDHVATSGNLSDDSALEGGDSGTKG
jgi:anti-sigma factor (TIGR02949 family)